MRALASLLLTLLLCGPLQAAPGFPGAEAIQAARARSGVEHLASDALEGRGSGTRGGRQAGDWIAEQASAAGLQAAGDGSWFQPFQGQGQRMRNVLGKIPGREPGEAIVIGAHYDHLGRGEQPGSLDFGMSRGRIHNGADDNASGTVAVLEIARAFQASGQRPRRTVLFAWFDGEERGLLGSRHWVAHPTLPERVVAMINIDMVGRLSDTLAIEGAPTGDLFAGWLERANEGLGLRLHLDQSLPPNSDHDSFYKRGIPVLAPFTGLHPDYHRPSDDADKVSVEGIVRIARLCYGVAVQAADAERAPRFAKVRDGSLDLMLDQLQQLFGGRPKAAPTRARLGVSVDQDGVTVLRVHAGGVAERAGVRAGDTILAVGGERVRDLAGLRAAVGRARGEVALRVRRGGEELELRAPFEGPAREPAPSEPAPREPAPSEPGPRWF
ncbi:MAG: M20/M25/M40 family metallo-hydrolase [Planctomycetota bacterium]